MPRHPGHWTPGHPNRCLRTAGEPGPARLGSILPTPIARPGRTFTRAQRAEGGRSKPSSSRTRRPTPPARGPPSSGDPAMLPQRAGLRTGGLAGKCAAPGRAVQAAMLCDCARRGGGWGQLPSPAHPLPPLDAGASSELPLQPFHPARLHGDAQGARWRAGDCDGGCHGTWRAVARATDLAVALTNRLEKLTQMSGMGVWSPLFCLEEQIYGFVYWMSSYRMPLRTKPFTGHWVRFGDVTMDHSVHHSKAPLIPCIKGLLVMPLIATLIRMTHSRSSMPLLSIPVFASIFTPPYGSPWFSLSFCARAGNCLPLPSVSPCPSFSLSLQPSYSLCLYFVVCIYLFLYKYIDS